MSIAGEGVMFPEVLAKPGSATGHMPEPGGVGGGGSAPEIDVVMRDPAVDTVICFCCFGARDRDVLESDRQGLVALDKLQTSAGQ